MPNERAGRIAPASEQAYWHSHFSRQPWGGQSAEPYNYEEDYEPAYRYGWEARQEYPNHHWEDIQEELESNWEDRRYGSHLSWDEAREACQDAFSHYLKEAPSSDQPHAGEAPAP